MEILYLFALLGIIAIIIILLSNDYNCGNEKYITRIDTLKIIDTINIKNDSVYVQINSLNNKIKVKKNLKRNIIEVQAENIDSVYFNIIRYLDTFYLPE